MGKGRRRGQRTDHRGVTGEEAETSEEFLMALLGEPSAEPTGAPVKPKDLPIAHILPDPAQPRRAIPLELRTHWLNGAPVGELLTSWEQAMRQSMQEKKLEYAWKHLVDPEDTGAYLDESKGKREAALPPVAVSWMALARLAGSIHQAGLEQPITVYEADDGYRVQSGERRLLAFHLLNWMGKPDYDRIPAILRDQHNVWRQAFENGARQDLNAIGKARQLALLLMALNKDKGKAYRGAQPDQAWYAQAASFRVPYGKAEAVFTVMGLPSARMVRRYRQLLALPREVWDLADEHNWTEKELRTLWELAQKLTGQEDNSVPGDRFIELAHLKATRQKLPSIDTGDAPLTLDEFDRAKKTVQKYSTPDRKVSAQQRQEIVRELEDLHRLTVEALKRWRSR